MSGLPRRRYATAPVVLLLALSSTLSSCSDDSSEPSASESSSTPGSDTSNSPSPSPSTTGTPAPRLPKAPAAKNTPAGRRDFARFVVERWGYSLRTNKATALTDLSPPAKQCEGCAKLKAELKQRAKEGWYVDFPGAKVVKVDVSPGAEPGVQVAKAKIDVPASQSYFDDGELRNENKARKGATFEVRMRFTGKKYVLLAFRVI